MKARMALLPKAERRERTAAMRAASQTEEAKKKRRESIRAAWALLTPEERRRKVRPWINKGQEARGTKTASPLERIVQEALNYFGVEYEPHADVCGFEVDFLVPSQNVVLEVDGYFHTHEDMMRRDKIRDAEIQAKGLKVVRITERQVHENAYVAVANALHIPI